MATFQLDPDLVFLNHGSFGAVPVEVQQAQDALRRQLELDPVNYMVRLLPGQLDGARHALGEFLGAAPEQLAFVSNATTGVNAVLGSFPLTEGDEVLTTSHRYDAVFNTIARHTQRAGASVVVADVPFPFPAAWHTPSTCTQGLVEAVCSRITPRTRLIVIDHIASPTAIIFPVREICARARDLGVPVLVDGAHVPGQLDLADGGARIDRIGATFWTGNLHKWLCAPRGTAVLWVDQDWTERVHHPVASHGENQGLHAEFDWFGTIDPTGWVASARALSLHAEDGGPLLRRAHHGLVRQGRQVVAAALGVALPHPDLTQLYGSMATIPLPPSAGPASPARALALNRALFEDHRVEVPIICWSDRLWVRISGFAVYNHEGHYQRLARALQDLLAKV